jgi:hypothetical protein
MQTIGKTEDGRILAALTALEYNILATIGQMFAVRDIELSLTDSAVAAPVTPVKKVVSGSAAGTPAATELKSTSNRRRKCEICCKVFYDNSKTNRRKICDKAECAKELKRRQNLAYKQRNDNRKKLQTQAVSTTPNPADPFLTDEQRKEVMARREKLIAESARRHAED